MTSRIIAKKVSKDYLGVLENSEQVFVTHSMGYSLNYILSDQCTNWDWISVSNLNGIDADFIPIIAFYSTDLYAINYIKSHVSSQMGQPTPIRKAISIYIKALLINNIIFFNSKYPTKDGFELTLETDKNKGYTILNKIKLSEATLAGQFNVFKALYYSAI